MLTNESSPTRIHASSLTLPTARIQYAFSLTQKFTLALLFNGRNILQTEISLYIRSPVEKLQLGENFAMRREFPSWSFLAQKVLKGIKLLYESSQTLPQKCSSTVKFSYRNVRLRRGFLVKKVSQFYRTLPSQQLQTKHKNLVTERIFCHFLSD